MGSPYLAEQYKSDEKLAVAPSYEAKKNMPTWLVVGALAMSTFLGFKAEAPTIFSAETTNQVQPDSEFDIKFKSIVAQPVPKFGYTFAEVESGKWHIVKSVDGELLGKHYQFDLPATGRSAEFKHVPIQVETTGSDFDVYTWKKGEINQQTGKREIDVTVDTEKIDHEVNFLPSGYKIAGSENEQSYIAVIQDPSTRIGNYFLQTPGNYAEALCNGAASLLSKESFSWCKFLSPGAKDSAIKDAKVENSARQAALESTRKCLASVWGVEQQMITSAIQKIIGSQMDYPEESWPQLIKVNFKDASLPDYTKSSLDELVAKGVLTKADLDSQGYKATNALKVTCKTEDSLSLASPSSQPSPAESR
ncbi:hypothetical protein H6794_02520 [Candidatus Nomurabacteria bacterium]|nr:hypothetical protein [Candidatus Saccharibacteria bacterium]MCB9839705.1 hypothetical protein [Candidatus Nomurabacteria bacterium]